MSDPRLSRLAQRLRGLSASQRRWLARRLDAERTDAIDPLPAGAPRLQLIAYVTPGDPAARQPARQAGSAASGDASRASPPARDDPAAAALALELEHHLRAQLPSYLCPARLVVLDAMPRLPNGKVDTAGLPAPPVRDARRSASLEAACAMPADRAEQPDPVAEKLASILGALLGMDDVRASDNFFELGGDSITAIQFVSQAREAGIAIDLPAVTSQPSLAALAAAADGTRADAGGFETVARTADDADRPRIEAFGPTPLTAIQAWFFSQPHPQPQWWNLGGRLDLGGEVDAERLGVAIRQVVARHPQLGARFNRTAGQADGRWTCMIPRSNDWSGLVSTGPDASGNDTLREAVFAAMQSKFSLSEGRLIGFAIVPAAAGASAELCWVAHHLLVDPLSMQLLLQAIESAYRQAGAPAVGVIQPAFAAGDDLSLREWALRMQPDGAEGAAVTQHRVSFGTEAQTREHVSRLSGALTRQLLEAGNALATRVDAVLLAVVARALARQRSSMRAAPGAVDYPGDIERDLCRIDVETHGRDSLGTSVDTARTIGWFTSFFPFEPVLPGGLTAAIRDVSEQLRQRRDDQRRYLIDRFLGAGDGAGRSGPESPPPRAWLLFNYAGGGPVQRGAWRALPCPAHRFRAPDNVRAHPLELNAVIDTQGLRLVWRHATAHIDVDTMRRIDADVHDELARLAARAQDASSGAGQDRIGLAEAGLDEAALDGILDQLGGAARD